MPEAEACPPHAGAHGRADETRWQSRPAARTHVPSSAVAAPTQGQKKKARLRRRAAEAAWA
eukprot:8488604-Alexandrium_andersonii.AAC.1